MTIHMRQTLVCDFPGCPMLVVGQHNENKGAIRERARSTWGWGRCPSPAALQFRLLDTCPDHTGRL